MTSTFARGLGLALAGLALSCSLVVQRDGVQCNTNEDCTKRGGAFASSVCSMDKVCVGAAPACTKNADCAQQPALCRNSACVALLNQDCTQLVPAMQTVPDEAIVIATLNSLKGTNQSSGKARQNSVELALSEIARDVVGLPPLGPGQKPRPLVALACSDNDGMMDVPQRAADHIRAVGLPAVIGPGGSGLVTTVANNVTIPGGIFLITPSATSTSLSGLNPLVWRTAPSDVVQAKAIAASITELEASYRAATMLPMTTLTKLFVVYKDDAYGAGLFNEVTKTATINGRVVTDPMNATNYRGKGYMASATDLSSFVTDILNFRPHLIALFGTTEVITKVLQPVETGWPMMVLRPAYVISDGGKKPELLTAAMGNDPLRVRIRGTVPGTNSQLFSAFRNRYTSKFQGAFPDVFGMAGAYDSTYLVALAITSLGAKPVTGAGIAEGMKKMVGGTKFIIGQDKTQDAFNVIGSGKPLDVDGASGPLDFDVNLHEAPSDIDVFCIANQAGMPVFSSSGRFFDAATQKMAGVFNCP